MKKDKNVSRSLLLLPDAGQFTVKEFKKSVPDRITGVSAEKDVAVMTIPNGRVKILPLHKKIKLGYSLRNGGRKHNGMHIVKLLKAVCQTIIL